MGNPGLKLKMRIAYVTDQHSLTAVKIIDSYNKLRKYATQSFADPNLSVHCWDYAGIYGMPNGVNSPGYIH